jgi:thiamine-monophosphate kinase
MRISELGEFGLIERFKRQIKLDSSVVEGTGDDCAVIKFSQDKYLLFTCDMIIEGVDFLKREDPYLIGRKSVAVSISDIAACAGLPYYCLAALALPKDVTLKFVDALFKGMRDMAKRFKINLVGGDLSRSKQVTIDVSMLGLVEKASLVLRSGAEKGDIIFVTGALGGTLAGKHLRFDPRVKEARFLAKNFKPSAMIDISDGLSQDLGHILAQSSKGAVIYEELIPVSSKAASLHDAICGGEDFELLFTLSRNKAKRLLRNNPMHFKPIGEITDKIYGLRLIDKRGRQHKITPKGFRHF